MSEAPKLYVNKPKKAQIKQLQQQQQLKGKEMQSSTASQATASAAALSYKGGGGGGGGAAVKPPEPPKESFARRYKFLWPLILGVNIAVGAYLFVRTKKDGVVDEEVPSSSPTTATTPTPPAVTEKPSVSPLPLLPAAAPVKLQEPVPENLQRELFKWILEEKRKIKPKDSEEKKRIEEDKAILKQFIRAKSIPPL
ncbi:hypothetical protein Dimus_027581 [Dionaea muscipula]